MIPLPDGMCAAAGAADDDDDEDDEEDGNRWKLDMLDRGLRASTRDGRRCCLAPGMMLVEDGERDEEEAARDGGLGMLPLLPRADGVAGGGGDALAIRELEAWASPALETCSD